MKTQTIATFIVPDGLSERVERYAVTACGGATVSGLQSGAWDSGDRLIREPVRTVTVFGPLGALWALAYSVALRLEHAGEDAVAFTVDGSAYVETLGEALRSDILQAVRDEGLRAFERGGMESLDFSAAFWDAVRALGDARDAFADFEALDLERPRPGETEASYRDRLETAAERRAALGLDDGSGRPGVAL